MDKEPKEEPKEEFNEKPKEGKQNERIWNCKICNLKFSIYNEYERHRWTKHPCNDIERHWANTDWSKWKGSTYYRDDPYY